MDLAKERPPALNAAPNPHFPHLFSPLNIGRMRLRNRVLLSAMTTGFGFRGGAPTDDALSYYAARSVGVGLAVVGFSAVSPEGRVEDAIAWLWEDRAAGAGAEGEGALASLVEVIHSTGALAGIQLGHGGRQVSPKVIGDRPVAPSALPPSAHVRLPPRPLSTAEAEEVVSAFGHAACRAARGGFDAVEIHGGHGYLIGQFLSAASNRRSDRFGGSTVSQRSRFGCEVIEKARSAADDLTVIVRINGSDLTEDGLTTEDATLVARHFAEAGAEAFVVSAGVYGSVPWTIPLLDDPEGAFLEFAEEVRHAVDVPVAAVGRITSPELAEAAVADGRCDAVALGRALLADPDWVAKAAGGRSDTIRPCIATVQGCAGQLQFGEGISCSVNPEVGRESLRATRDTVTNSADANGADARRVIVVGGGPAGMEAARRAAELGHRAVLLERERRLGGALLVAAVTPGLTHLERLVRWYEGELERLGVEVRLGERVRDLEQFPLGEGAAVVVATGAATAPEALEGYEHLPAWTLEDLLAGSLSTLNTPLPEGRIALLGGGSRALAAALWCRSRGCAVAMLSPGPMGRDTSGLVRRAYQARLTDPRETAPPALLLQGRAVRILPEGIEWKDKGGNTDILDAEGVVVAEPTRPVIPLSFAGAAAGGREPGGDTPLMRIGDARRPRTIGDAIAEARGVVDELDQAGFSRR